MNLAYLPLTVHWYVISVCFTAGFWTCRANSILPRILPRPLVPPFAAIPCVVGWMHHGFGVSSLLSWAGLYPLLHPQTISRFWNASERLMFCHRRRQRCSRIQEAVLRRTWRTGLPLPSWRKEFPMPQGAGREERVACAHRKDVACIIYDL